MKEAYGYIRVSGKGQVRGTGLQRQEAAIREYANANRFQVIQIFQEKGVSGTEKKDRRPAFQEMMAIVLKDGVCTIIVEGLDRLAREYTVQEQLLIYLASKEVELISANTGENVTEAIKADPMKKAMIQIQGVFAELEKNILVGKLRKARERKKKVEGKCEGRKSYLEISPEIVKKIKLLRRRNRKGKRRTFSQVAKELNRQGMTTMTGKPFTSNNVAVILHRVKSH